MGFFSTFSEWLDGILIGYIANNTAKLATLLEPTIITLATIYVMVWGYLQLTGKIEEPFVAGLKRIIVLAVVLGGSLDLWLYNALIVDTFFNAPGQLAAGIIGTYQPVTVIDQVMFTGGDAASMLLQKAGVFQGNFSFYIAGYAVYLLVGITAVYAMFLLALSKIGLSVLLALGPLFIALLFFETTKRFFESWVAQLTNYAFIAILTVMVAALMLEVVTTAAQTAVNQKGGITIAEAVRVCLASGLTFLVMRQVMPMAAGLASGLALSSFGMVSGLMMWGLRRGLRHTGQFSRGVFDRETSRWDPLSRKAGYYLRKAPETAISRVMKVARPNTVSR